MATVTTDVTKLLTSGPGTQFGNVYLVTRSDGGAFTDSTGGLTSGQLDLDVTNGNALEGFPPSVSLAAGAGYVGQGPGFTPDGQLVRVRGYGKAPGAVVVDDTSYLKDTNDPTNTSMKITLFMTSAVFTSLIIECPC